MRADCLPTYVISSYSNVRVQQPMIDIPTVESQMPMDIMLNPLLADEPPMQTDKIESINNMNSEDEDEMKTINNHKTMETEESEMMTTINKQSAEQQNNDESDSNKLDLVVMEMVTETAPSVSETTIKVS
ncbi:hypothetical protein PVAND_000774 [Polypedilum vanderplanki]|uniref:Uncharacterized protein n=1 Tax=Polypedilum vanderplanki TaxID=319348 RepID=A0A9J6BM25_POLVA|nr:hypothetical protein PVAND_000774 [Polypedilum vanderplanki]